MYVLEEEIMDVLLYKGYLKEKKEKKIKGRPRKYESKEEKYEIEKESMKVKK
jgi:hypothetical protein